MDITVIKDTKDIRGEGRMVFFPGRKIIYYPPFQGREKNLFLIQYVCR